MTAALRLARPYLTIGAASRALFGGTVWGVLMAAGFLALSAWNCGGVCLGEAVHTLAFCVGTGILTIGPVCAAVGRR